MNKEHTEKLLNALHENLTMAVQSLELIIPEIDDKEFLTYITNQNEQYNTYLNECLMLAKSYDIELKKHNFEKAQLWVSLKMNTLFDKSVRKHAELIYFGTSMGIPDLITAMADFDEAEKEALELANKLKLSEEDYEMEIKQFIAKGKPQNKEEQNKYCGKKNADCDCHKNCDCDKK